MARKPKALRVNLTTQAAPAISLDVLGHKLAESILAGAAAIRDIRAQVDGAQTSALANVYAVAKLAGDRKLTAAEYDEKLWPAMEETFVVKGIAKLTIGSYKSLYRVGFLGMCNGHAVTVEDTSIRKYVDRVRPLLAEAGVIAKMESNRKGTGKVEEAATGSAGNTAEGGNMTPVQQLDAAIRVISRGRVNTHALLMFLFNPGNADTTIKALAAWAPKVGYNPGKAEDPAI